MSDQPSTTYLELADVLDALPLILREACRARHVTQQTAARQIGLSPSTISRLLSGAGAISLEGATAVLRWLDQPARPPMRGGVPPAAHDLCGRNADRQSVGDPGHCEDCCSVGHVVAHPELGCGDVGCYRTHGEEADRG